MTFVEAIVRLFPALRASPLAERVVAEMALFDPPQNPRNLAPFPTDKLRCRGTGVVEYRTTAGADGLGTRWPA